jgi:hypothetical protein
LKYPIPPNKAEWLLWPARLRIYAHEIMMDNDVVLLKRHPIIDNFLKSKNSFFATEGIHPLPYGNYRDIFLADPKLYDGPPINSGFFGVPPFFDTEDFYLNFYKKFGTREYIHTNPQAVVAYMIKTHKHKVIRKNEIYVAGHKQYGSMAKSRKEIDKIYGIHFVGINRGFYRNWRAYCAMIDYSPKFCWLPKKDES